MFGIAVIDMYYISFDELLTVSGVKFGFKMRTDIITCILRAPIDS